MLFNPASSRLQALAVHWSLVGMALTALAREISLAHKLRADWGIAKAGLLEAALFTALIALSREISDHSAGCAPRSAEDEAAFAHLKTVHAMLSVMCLLIQQLRRDLASIAEQWAVLMGARQQFARLLFPRREMAPAFLDSG